jgi:hypothetical protein
MSGFLRVVRRPRGKSAVLWACAVVAAVAVAVVGATAAIGQGNGSNGSQMDPAWLTQTLKGVNTPSALKTNLVSGAISQRDAATTEWRQALARYQQAVSHASTASGSQRAQLQRAATSLAPDPYAKPEYVVVWASHANASDENYQQASSDVGKLAGDPTHPPTDAQSRFVPGLDGFFVIDARRDNLNGTRSPTYGHVVNFAQLPPPWGVETEAHHMQYQWEDGQPLLAGGLFNTTTFVVGTNDIPKLNLLDTFPPQSAPGGSIPDAYDYIGNGRFAGTYMGGPTYNYGGSPGEVVTFKPDGKGGYQIGSETPAGQPDARDLGNPNGLPEPCSQDEAQPLGTCANPHGIQARPDLGRMITSDYGEPKTVVLDPVKPPGGTFFRPTIRVWDISDPDHPKMVSVAHMPNGWRPPNPSNTMLQNRGIMENAKTWPVTRSFPHTLASKGAFAGAMCGGGVFFTADITKLKGDSTHQWHEVWDDGLSLLAARGGDVNEWMHNEGTCEAGAWTQVSRNNHWLFRTVGGNAPNQSNLSNSGGPTKIIYDIDVQALIKDAQTGNVQCDLVRGMDLNGDGKIDISGPDVVKQIAQGKQVGDCPHLISTLRVDDTTTGGPHWGALDNHSLTPDGAPTRMVFADYFVARSGVDGNHHLYMANIDPSTGQLSYDNSWLDEVTGERGINFNRVNWPGNPGAGYYKPHSMVWVCPPGICPADSPGP